MTTLRERVIEAILAKMDPAPLSHTANQATIDRFEGYRRQAAEKFADAAIAAMGLTEAGKQWRYRAVGRMVGEWNDWVDGEAPKLRSITYDVEERPIYIIPEPPKED